MDKWSRHMLQLCDQPVRYDREGTTPQNRLIAACHTTSEELQQLVHEPEICRKEMEAARGSVLSQSWLSTILTHFDQNPEQRTFTRQELELALEREGSLIKIPAGGAGGDYICERTKRINKGGGAPPIKV